jgi:hypothetical protein
MTLTELTYSTDNIRAELIRYIGKDYAHTTHDGETMVGVVEFSELPAHQIGSYGYIVRFADGRWARCDVRCDA